MRAKNKFKIKPGENTPTNKSFLVVDKVTDKTVFIGTISEVGAWLALYEEGFII